VLRPLHVFRFSLQTCGKREWRDPDSNRGHHDFHIRRPLGKRKTRVGKRIYVHRVPLDTTLFCPYCCATVDTASSLFRAPEAERVSLRASLVY
jgi:hypothetical protein